MTDRDYVLGTQDEEIERLDLQHRVWRPRMLDAWRRAGIGRGQTVLDIGAGPGFAALDLADLVGAGGKVIALERSTRFLAALEVRAAGRGISNIEAREQDVSERDFGEEFADASWCRWLLSFVADPRATIAHIARALKPGGYAVFHEYADYGTWRMMPPHPEMDRFRALVMQSWRDAGGEPDIALRLPAWLAAEGMEVIELRPLIEIVRRTDFTWQWPEAFMNIGARRLHELGYVTGEEADRFAHILNEADPAAWMITPLVAEVIARRL